MLPTLDSQHRDAAKAEFEKTIARIKAMGRAELEDELIDAWMQQIGEYGGGDDLYEAAYYAEEIRPRPSTPPAQT
jgi:hypothetical protein